MVSLAWAEHGICGRGVFLDLVEFYTSSGTKPLPYDPWTTHAIPVEDLKACARAQSVTFRQGDILILRVGFIKRYNESSAPEKDAISGKPETLYVFLSGSPLLFLDLVIPEPVSNSLKI